MARRAQVVVPGRPHRVTERGSPIPTNLNQTTSRNGVGLTWDANGNLLTHGSTGYQWTYGNRRSGDTHHFHSA